MRKTELLYPKLSYLIIGICFDAHNELGRFAREKQYGSFIQKKLKDENIRFERELAISDSGNIMDFLIEQKVVLELKVKDMITKNDYFQLQRYLQSSGIKLGILVNFRNKYLRPKRILKTNK
ncbi:GxxExxY protein [Patescibacteria group bacterium]|nr:GxxExxY protein [Patescibacteria group bacterium]